MKTPLGLSPQNSFVRFRSVNRPTSVTTLPFGPRTMGSPPYASDTHKNLVGKDKTVVWPSPESFLLFPNFITDEEHSSLVKCSMAQLDSICGKKLLNSHYDGVINKYRECSVSSNSWSVDNDIKELLLINEDIKSIKIIRDIIKRVHNTIDTLFDHKYIWLPPHLLDVAADGEIRSHLDNLNASGDIIAGISLLSSALVRFKIHTEKDELARIPVENKTLKKSSIKGLPLSFKKSNKATSDVKIRKLSNDKDIIGYIEAFIPQGSLYIQSGDLRYNFEHEISDKEFEWDIKNNDSLPNLNLGLQKFTKNRRISVLFRSAIEK